MFGGCGRVTVVRDGADYDIPVGHQSPQIPIVNDQDAADAVVAHHLRRVGHRLTRPQLVAEYQRRAGITPKTGTEVRDGR